MRILFITLENPFSDKILSKIPLNLAFSLKNLKIDVSLVSPAYQKKGKIIKKGLFFKKGKGEFDLYKKRKEGVDIYLISRKKSSGKGETPKSSGKEILFFSLAILKICEIFDYRILVIFDQGSSPLPYLVEYFQPFRKTLFFPFDLKERSFPSKDFPSPLKIQMENLLETALGYADFLIFPSESYFKEKMKEKMVLKKILKDKKIFFCPLGIDQTLWDPEIDKFIFKNYSIYNLKEREKNKKKFLKENFKKIDLRLPLVSVIYPEDKESIFKILKSDLKLYLFLATKKEISFFKKFEKIYPQKFSLKKINEKDLHQIFASSDISLFLFEDPLGVLPKISLKYGSVPLLPEKGVYKNTVKKIEKIPGWGFKWSINHLKIKGNSFFFKDKEKLLTTLKKILKDFENKKIWQTIQINGMREDFSFKLSAKKFLQILKKISSSL